MWDVLGSDVEGRGGVGGWLGPGEKKEAWAKQPIYSLEGGGMEIPELLRIHQCLHFPGGDMAVEHVDKPYRLFSRVNVGRYLFITQNMRKPSANTRLVRECASIGIRMSLTWVLKDGRYVGKISSWGQFSEERDDHWEMERLSDHKFWFGFLD